MRNCWSNITYWAVISCIYRSMHSTDLSDLEKIIAYLCWIICKNSLLNTNSFISSSASRSKCAMDSITKMALMDTKPLTKRFGERLELDSNNTDITNQDMILHRKQMQCFGFIVLLLYFLISSTSNWMVRWLNGFMIFLRARGPGFNSWLTLKFFFWNTSWIDFKICLNARI